MDKVMKKLVVALASVVVLGIVPLAGCGKSSSKPTSTPSASTSTSTSQSVQTTPPSAASTSTPNAAVADQYNAWASKFATLASTFTDAAAAQDFAKAANAMDAIGAHAKAGKALPSTGNAKADTEWQNAMDDLSTASAIGAPACRSQDSDKLMDAMDLFMQASDHISSWVDQFI